MKAFGDGNRTPKTRPAESMLDVSTLRKAFAIKKASGAWPPKKIFACVVEGCNCSVRHACAMI